ncbi:DUF1848 family protein [Anaeroselena agilis]|uniref:DUF1848 family protein n=1 Tax=Anaeroselena agilis TaxID=3063788 RepID=A0ABU3NZ63_9FIRM|nr:DUF1848 family protein [Selenomonadales bacterium 4137-cl]
MAAKLKTVISASRRTDLPRFHYRWLQDALRAGEAVVVNPRFPAASYRVDLRPESVHTVVLWSKDFANILADPGRLADYNLYFHYTVNNYSPLLEPGVPPYAATLRTLEGLLARHRPEQFTIRFDPVIISTGGELRPDPAKPGRARLAAFERLCRDLAALGMRSCRLATSHIALYPHVKKRLAAAADLGFVPLEDNLLTLFFTRLAEIAAAHGLTLRSCASPLLAAVPGLVPGRCVDGDLLAALAGEKASRARDGGQRAACGCTKSVDIGGYAQTCGFNCLYCYARH